MLIVVFELCQYVQTCIGYKNKPAFFFFVLFSVTTQLASVALMYICITQSTHLYIFFPAIVVVGMFGSMLIVLLGTAVSTRNT